MQTIQTTTLTAQGATVPALGFGTWQIEGDDATHMVRTALETGYRHIDTAQAYENEAAVGAGIAQAGVPREDIWLTTKVWIDQFAGDDLERSAHHSLDKLGTDYVDLLLLHWPAGDVPLEETMAALDRVARQGVARHIGISNFTTAQIDRAVAASETPVLTNQVEYHPFLDQSAVIAKLKQHDMLLTAYSPNAQGKVFDNSTLNAIGDRYGKNGGQVALRWLLQQGVIAIPRSSSPDHIRDNADIFDFELSDTDMQAIHGLAQPDGRLISPSFAPDWD